MIGVVYLLAGFVTGLALFFMAGFDALAWFIAGAFCGMLVDAATAPRIP
jgi:hypothetical protein